MAYHTRSNNYTDIIWPKYAWSGEALGVIGSHFDYFCFGGSCFDSSCAQSRLEKEAPKFLISSLEE